MSPEHTRASRTPETTGPRAALLPDQLYDVWVTKLRRVQLDSAFTEASALLSVQSPGLLTRLGTEEAWWIVHDEAGLANMVSIVFKTKSGDTDAGHRWSIAPATILAADDGALVTDAEALANADGMVFVVGSAFVNRRGRLDTRRSFLARFVEADVEIGSGEILSGEVTVAVSAQVLMLSTELVVGLNSALDASDIDLMKLRRGAARRFAKSDWTDEPRANGTGSSGSTGASGKTGRSDNTDSPGRTDSPGGGELLEDSELPDGWQPVNVEGAAIIGDDLLLGLRWPVSHGGQPLVAILKGGREALAAKDWSRATLLECPTSIRVIKEVGTSKRPAGIRAMSEVDGELHIVCGPTDRDLAASEVRAAKLQHVMVDLVAMSVTKIRSFEGFRKVEALAPARDKTGWIYALDDEDAIVLLETTDEDG